MTQAPPSEAEMDAMYQQFLADESAKLVACKQCKWPTTEPSGICPYCQRNAAER